jgi:hypothetical protein
MECLKPASVLSGIRREIENGEEILTKAGYAQFSFDNEVLERIESAAAHAM